MYGPFKPILISPFFRLEEASHTYLGNKNAYYRLSGHDSVICCILDQTDNFVMVKQFRPNLGITTLETPAGGIEKGESAIKAAHREIAEETGLSCALLPLGQTFSLMMNRTNIKDHLYLGMYPKYIPNFEKEPGIEVAYIPRKELLDLAIAGEYIQLAGLGILMLASGVMKIDMWHSPLEDIQKAFCDRTEVQWHYDK